MPRITDGTGQNLEAKVDSENRLHVFSVSEPLDRHVNGASGKVWSIPFEGLNPAAADDVVVYIKNTGTPNLLVSDIRVMADTAATQIKVIAVTGTAAGGSDIVPVSRTVGSAALPDATIQSGADITGLSDTGVLFFIQCVVVDTEYHLSTSSQILIPKSRAIALSVETGTANITGVISLIETDQT